MLYCPTAIGTPAFCQHAEESILAAFVRFQAFGFDRKKINPDSDIRIPRQLIVSLLDTVVDVCSSSALTPLHISVRHCAFSPGWIP